uniref:Uncharacterized protein n=1 Tax=Salix viminalis TaxID=40686 RepID=A0A6N2LLZ8_SALVM
MVIAFIKGGWVVASLRVVSPSASLQASLKEMLLFLKENVDIVVIRENTEGEYAGLEHEVVPGAVESLKENVDIVVIRENTEGEYVGLEHEVVPGAAESLKVMTGWHQASRNVIQSVTHYSSREALQRGDYYQIKTRMEYDCHIDGMASSIKKCQQSVTHYSSREALQRGIKGPRRVLKGWHQASRNVIQSVTHYSSREALQRGIKIKFSPSTSLQASLKEMLLFLKENVDIVVIRENTEGEYAGLEHEVVPGAVESLKENVDIVVIRENTEGEYVGLEHEVVPGAAESLKGPRRVLKVRNITRHQRQGQCLLFAFMLKKRKIEGSQSPAMAIKIMATISTRVIFLLSMISVFFLIFETD